MVRMECFATHEEWLEARTSRVGGSDAGCILGLNPWKDNVQLWKEKIGLAKDEDISGKDVVKYGHDAEPLLRKLWELDHPSYKMEYEEDNMWTNDKFAFAHASLDGWLTDPEGRKGIWECKTTEIMNSSQWSKWDGMIPDQYFAQILHYMAVTEFEFAILNVQIKYRKCGELFKTTREYKIERKDVVEDIAYLMEKEKEFYDCIVSKHMPNMILPGM